MTINICYYISDYGFGHATRSSAVIKIAVERLGRSVNFYVKCSSGHTLLKRTFQHYKNVKIIRCKNDVGIKHFPGSILMDRRATKSAVLKWFSEWDSYIAREKRFIKNKEISTVAVDVCPQPLIAAGETGINGLVVSNFNWLDIYKPIFKSDADMDNAMAGIKDAYSAANAITFPFCLDSSVYKKSYKIGLVSRAADKNSGLALLKKHKRPLENNIFFTTGFSTGIDNSVLDKIVKNSRLNFIFASNIKLPGRKSCFKVPKDYTEAQNLIANCSAVVAKSGYSTVSEVINSRVPLFLMARPDFAEDRFIINELTMLGIGMEIAINDLTDPEFFNTILGKAAEMKKNYSNLPKEFKSVDHERIVEELRG